MGERISPSPTTTAIPCTLPRHVPPCPHMTKGAPERKPRNYRDVRKICHNLQPRSKAAICYMPFRLLCMFLNHSPSPMTV